MTSVRRVEHRSLPLASTEVEDPISISAGIEDPTLISTGMMDTALGADPSADLATEATVVTSAEDTAPAFAVAARAI